MKKYNGSTDIGNILLISSKSHPVCLVQSEITERVKENTKIYFITNEGTDDYIKHCKDLNGEYKNLSNIDISSLDSQYIILDITEEDCHNEKFLDNLYNILKCIWEDVQSKPGEKAIYLNNLYIFFDERYKTNDIVQLLLEMFCEARRYECSIIVFNWKPIDFTNRYCDENDSVDYTSKILGNIKTFILTIIENNEDMKIISDVFHLTEKEEKALQALKTNEGMIISDNVYDWICW